MIMELELVFLKIIWFLLMVLIWILVLWELIFWNKICFFCVLVGFFIDNFNCIFLFSMLIERKYDVIDENIFWMIWIF